jgi:pantoate--beta-alanine ligase
MVSKNNLEVNVIDALSTESPTAMSSRNELIDRSAKRRLFNFLKTLNLAKEKFKSNSATAIDAMGRRIIQNKYFI